jgi:D-alanyl-lipoteichoic acid acyltransferase DltB (MBOAT superfamily)
MAAAQVKPAAPGKDGMLFSSFPFLLAFLPCCLGVYFLVARGRQSHWLIACSFFFCAYQDLRFLVALLASAAFNFGAGEVLRSFPGTDEKRRGRVLALAVAANLAALGYFKYRNFFLGSVSPLWVPLGISFFTFTQISYLVATSYPDARKISLTSYLLHVSFFPKLIAGPIVRFEEWMPQLEEARNRKFNLLNFVPGLLLFSVGLFKKAFIADPIGNWVGALFSFATPGATPYFLESWCAALGYLTQLYFDFSGYSDMAIGIALILNVRFPLNFNSPYQATSVVEFWKRWHMTLSSFLNDYLFTPLAKRNPRSRAWQNVCLFTTMTICGIWHGAGWPFVVFGLLHATYVVTNHVWRRQARSAPKLLQELVLLVRRPLTLLCVTVAFVVFRADTLGSATAILKGMAGAGGFTLPSELSRHLGFLSRFGVSFAGIFHGENKLATSEVFLSLVPPLLVALFCPNIYQVLGLQGGKGKESARAWWQWTPSPAWSMAFAVVTGLGIVSLFSASRQFLYFQF